jgi:hypothetical protein
MSLPVGSIVRWIDERVRVVGRHELCENPCEKIFPKSAKMWKICQNVENLSAMKSVY